MPAKPSRARGRGGSILKGRAAAPVGASGRSKATRELGRQEREEHIPDSLAVDVDDDENDGSEEDDEVSEACKRKASR